MVGGGLNTLAGGTRAYIGRVNSNGTLDATFNPGTDADVGSLALQPDGKVLAAGMFWVLNGQNRHNIGRLTASDPPSESLHRWYWVD